MHLLRELGIRILLGAAICVVLYAVAPSLLTPAIIIGFAARIATNVLLR